MWLFALAFAEVLTSSACLPHGYPRGAVTPTFTRYCVKRVDQADVVVLLLELRQK